MPPRVWWQAATRLNTHTHTYTHTHTAGNGYMLCAPEEHVFDPVTKSYTGLSAYDIVCYLSIFL